MWFFSLACHCFVERNGVIFAQIEAQGINYCDQLYYYFKQVQVKKMLQSEISVIILNARLQSWANTRVMIFFLYHKALW